MAPKKLGFHLVQRGRYVASPSAQRKTGVLLSPAGSSQKPACVWYLLGAWLPEAYRCGH